MKTVKIDYKKELETASKGMIMIHDPKLLIKLIVRMIVSKVQIRHAGMILYEPHKDSYVLSISRGEIGYKIPAGYAKFDYHHPIISLFTKKEFRALMVNRSAILTQDLNRLIWQESVMGNGNGSKELLHKVGEQMNSLNVVGCVPAFYQNKLLAVLLLGEKTNAEGFDQNELSFFSALASDAAMAIRNAQLFEGVKRESEKNHELFIRATKALGSAIEAKDPYTHGHTERVTNYAVAIARQMLESGAAKFSEEFIEELYVGCILHDIGKIGIPEAILNKPGQLTKDEFDVMKQHPLYGVEILKPLSELKNSLDVVKHHHERYDGKGYPSGLRGEQIPMIAAIAAVADAFDAMTTDRPYRKGFTHAEGIEEVRKGIAVQFHPAPAKAIIELFELRRI